MTNTTRPTVATLAALNIRPLRPNRYGIRFGCCGLIVADSREAVTAEHERRHP